MQTTCLVIGFVYGLLMVRFPSLFQQIQLLLLGEGRWTARLYRWYESRGYRLTIQVIGAAIMLAALGLFVVLQAAK